MGRQRYLTTLAFGRSALESPEPDDLQNARNRSSQGPERQEYDAHGHPSNAESRTLHRNITTAQNDVLATCGYVARADGMEGPDQGDDELPSTAISDARQHFGTDKEMVELTVVENQVGVLFPLMIPHTVYISTWWLAGIRNRYQIFRTCSDLGFLDMIRVQQRDHGFFGLAFAGLPTELLQTILDFGKDFLLEAFHARALWLLRRWIPNRKRRRVLERALVCVVLVIDLASSIAIAPLQLFSTLQVLNLIPAYPFFPSVRSMIPFSASSPLSIPSMDGGLTIQNLGSLATSLIQHPLCMLWLHCELRAQLFALFSRRNRHSMPRPDHPDPTSVQAAMEQDLDEDSISGLVPTGAEPLHLPRWLVTPSPDSPSRTDPRFHIWAGRLFEVVERRGRFATTIERQRARVAARMVLSPMRRRIRQSGITGLEVESTIRASSPALTDDSRIVSDDEDEDEDEYGNEHPQWQARRHHVTTLSAYPAMSAISHTALFYSTWNMIPIESLILRTIAISYLSPTGKTAEHTNGSLLSSWIYAPWGGPSRSYVRRMIECMFADLVVRWGLFEVAYLSAVRIGRHFFGWGLF